MKTQLRTLLLMGSLASASVFVLSCGGRQSAVDAAGVQADRLEFLWWLFFWICAAVYAIVSSVLIIALIRNRRATESTAPEIAPDSARESRTGYAVKAAVAITLVVMFALMLVSFRTGSAISALPKQTDEKPLSIKITGVQWFWKIEYQEDIPSNNITTANELHLPVGRVVELELQSNDVIHSFWAPNLHGKKDLVPNYPTTFYFRPDKVGTFHGQCAEFCGYQHAKMRFVVVVHTQEDFEAWAASQRQAPSPPTDPAQQRGQRIFLTSTCVQCHAVQGTSANASVGPNLTHVASRQYIAAGSLPNTRDHLKQWITDPQRVKPGIRMPMNLYSDEDLDALVSYLESLK
jgi:cytochrome c oxidase subunit II